MFDRGVQHLLLRANDIILLTLKQVARGDVQGTVFEHLRAAKLLIDHVSSSVTHIPSNLQDFLVEYYTYTSTLSIISMDPASGNNIVLSSNMWDRAQGLVARQYVGSLCGGWLELLLLIPSIFYLDKGSSATEDNVLHRSADDISIFACLQSQIVSFSPHPSLRPKVALASRIYQQAMLLYLLTTLGIPENREGSMHGVLIENTISNAISLLEQLPPTERINTSLCWPLAVIGSCISIKSMQGVLRQRLRVMFDVIGLGNMRETLSLLEELWKLPSNQRSPWTIWKSMQDHHIQISFA